MVAIGAGLRSLSCLSIQTLVLPSFATIPSTLRTLVNSEACSSGYNTGLKTYFSLVLVEPIRDMKQHHTPCCGCRRLSSPVLLDINSATTCYRWNRCYEVLPGYRTTALAMKIDQSCRHSHAVISSAYCSLPELEWHRFWR